ncbi:MAG TPA: HNH endonuclease [Elusimicrobia bacterium]|nr:HNH endonuclease [Elusimicrobiota bacterium]
MGSDVLVLNRSFYAVQITSWQRALTLVYTDHASVVDQDYKTYSFEDWQQLSSMIKTHPSGFVTTPNFKIAIPEVIALKFYDRLPTSEVKFTRRNIYEHYNYRCCYCGNKFSSSELNLEHVIPKSRGGKTNWSNIVTSCIPCNLRKGNKMPDEAGMKMLITPNKPKWRGILSLTFGSAIKMKTSWQRFVDTVYWNGELEKE